MKKQLFFGRGTALFSRHYLDPATAYEKLTGTYDEKVSENTVYEELIHHISEENEAENKLLPPAANSSAMWIHHWLKPSETAIW